MGCWLWCLIMCSIECGLLLTVDHKACENEIATVTHPLPVTSKKSLSAFTQVFLSTVAHCSAICTCVSIDRTFLCNVPLNWQLCKSVPVNVMNVRKETRGWRKRQREREKEWSCSRRWVWLIWQCICGTGAVPHRVKINLRVLPSGQYNYWFPNPIWHTHHLHKKMRLKIWAAAVCYIHIYFYFLSI